MTPLEAESVVLSWIKQWPGITKPEIARCVNWRQWGAVSAALHALVTAGQVETAKYKRSDERHYVKGRAPEHIGRFRAVWPDEPPYVRSQQEATGCTRTRY